MGHENTANLLLEFQANPFIQSAQKRNALHFACSEGLLELVKKLIAQYPKLMEERDEGGKVPYDLAVREKHQNIMEYMDNITKKNNKIVLSFVK